MSEDAKTKQGREKRGKPANMKKGQNDIKVNVVEFFLSIFGLYLSTLLYYEH